MGWCRPCPQNRGGGTAAEATTSQYGSPGTASPVQAGTEYGAVCRYWPAE